MIPVTQYIRPNGQRKKIFVERSPEINDKALTIIGYGGEFTIENLCNGRICLCCEYDDSDVVIKICHNNEEVNNSFDELVTEAMEIIKNYPDSEEDKDSEDDD